MKNTLITEFELDRTSSQLNQMADKILSDGSFVFDNYEDKYIGDKLVTIIIDKSLWNNDYYLDQITLLNANFSKERLLHCLELREHIYGISYSDSKKKYYLILLGTLLVILAVGYLAIQTLKSENFQQTTYQHLKTQQDNNRTKQ